MKTTRNPFQQTNYNREFQKVLKRELGPTYPINSDDWDTANYQRACRIPAADAAQSWANNRKIGMSTAARIQARVWRDEFDGSVVVGPTTPEPVADTIRAAFENGCKHGTVFHWATVRQYHGACLTVPELYLWESL